MDRSSPIEAPHHEPLWAAVDALIDRAPRHSDLRSHGIELLAARRWRALGEPLPEWILRYEQETVLAHIAAAPLLERVRAAYDGSIVLLKGPEVAAAYPDPLLRRFGDLDLLVDDAERAQSALMEAGFEQVGDPRLYVDIHHLRPLVYRRLPLAIEVHSDAKWPAPLHPPATEELIATAIPSVVPVDGILAPRPEAHALLLAAHSWAHEPLRRLRDVVDIAAISAGRDRAEIEALARAWQVERLWQTTAAAIDAVFDGKSPPWELRVWAQNLSRVRERTVLENHLQRWLSDFSVLPTSRALSSIATTLSRELRPARGESWREKGSRSVRAVRHAFVRRSDHDNRP